MRTRGVLRLRAPGIVRREGESSLVYGLRTLLALLSLRVGLCTPPASGRRKD